MIADKLGSAGSGARFVTPIECPEAPPMPSASSPEAMQTLDALVQAARALPGVLQPLRRLDAPLRHPAEVAGVPGGLLGRDGGHGFRGCVSRRMVVGA